MLIDGLIEEILLKEEKVWGRDRLTPMAKFIKVRFTEYAERLSLPVDRLIQSAEKNRGYSAINYYQEAVFPRITDKIKIFETSEELRAVVGNEGFRCPACNGVSKDAYECDTGLPMKTRSGRCDWKSYGLFGTLGRGFTCIVREHFAEKPIPHHSFMPIAMEKACRMTEQKKKKSLRGVLGMNPEDRARVCRLGGLAVSRNRAHMAALGRIGGKTLARKYGKEHFRKLGKLGGSAKALNLANREE